MIKIGITGGIGSGKSLISNVFKSFMIPVYDSDFEAKMLYESDYILKQKLIQNFGSEVYLIDGSINRKYLGNIVFNDKEKLNELNQLVHPRVKLHFEKWLMNFNLCSYIIKESAILFESGAYKQVDKVIVVIAPDEIRINRVMERDSISRTSVIERIGNQLPQNELIDKSNFVIINDGKVALLPQVYSIHLKILGTI